MSVAWLLHRQLHLRLLPGCSWNQKAGFQATIATQPSLPAKESVSPECSRLWPLLPMVIRPRTLSPRLAWILRQGDPRITWLFAGPKPNQDLYLSHLASFPPPFGWKHLGKCVRMNAAVKRTRCSLNNLPWAKSHALMPHPVSVTSTRTMICSKDGTELCCISCNAKRVADNWCWSLLGTGADALGEFPCSYDIGDVGRMSLVEIDTVPPLGVNLQALLEKS